MPPTLKKKNNCYQWTGIQACYSDNLIALVPGIWERISDLHQPKKILLAFKRELNFSGDLNIKRFVIQMSCTMGIVYSRHSVIGPSVTGSIQLPNFY